LWKGRTILRRLKNTDSVFMPADAAVVERIEKIEGSDVDTPVSVRVQMKSDTMLMLSIHFPKGRLGPSHRHDDHETTCHLISGKLRIWIGDKAFVALPGDTWFHPKGVLHQSEALQESVQVEVKSPPVKTW
jgi:quercetin dioxygenase-like cupin family protein